MRSPYIKDPKLHIIFFRHYENLTPYPEDRGHPELVLAEWDTVGSGIVMVDARYNILYKKSVKDEEVHRITDDGVPGVIHNGVPDWVYEGNECSFLFIGNQ